jgi:hypothetical protein
VAIGIVYSFLSMSARADAPGVAAVLKGAVVLDIGPFVVG